MLSLSILDFDLSESNNVYDNDNETKEYILSCATSLFISIMMPIIFAGSVIFSISSGAGMVFLPYNLLIAYQYRPKKMEPEDYVITKRILQKESENSLEIAMNAYSLKRELEIVSKNDFKTQLILRKKFSSAIRKSIETLKEFEEMYEAFHASENILESNPLTYILCLIGGLFSFLLTVIIIVHSLYILNGLDSKLEKWLLAFESNNCLMGAMVFGTFCIYFGIVIYQGSIEMSQMLGMIFNFHPVKSEKTFLSSFFFSINFCILGFIGMMIYFVRNMPRYLRYIGFDMYFNRIVTKINILSYIYHFKFFEILMIGCFLITVFVLTFTTNGAMLLKQKLFERKEEIAEEKSKLQNKEKQLIQ